MESNLTREILELMQDLERRGSWTVEDRARWLERKDDLYRRLSEDGGT
jgi:hypothetical protein